MQINAKIDGMDTSIGTEKARIYIGVHIKNAAPTMKIGAAPVNISFCPKRRFLTLRGITLKQLLG